MFFHLQYIHLFRPFLKYTPSASPLPSHVSPRRICTANAGAISKLMRLYKKTYNLRQICNIAVYMVHSAVTIHLLNLPEKTAKRDVIHGIKHLEEVAEDWLCARRTLCIISVLARKWNCELPEEAAMVLQRTDEKYGSFSTSDVPSPNRSSIAVTPSPPPFPTSPVSAPAQDAYSPTNAYNQAGSPAVSQDVPAVSMAPDLLNGLAALSPPPPTTTMATTQMPSPLTQTVGVSEPLVGLGGWNMSAAVTQPVPNYRANYQPGHGSISGGTSQAGSTRQVTPNSVYPVDGQDWFLKDSVNWAHNFEGWGLNTGMPDGSMFLFRGVPDRDTTFDSLSNSMTDLDHLPGLD